MLGFLSIIFLPNHRMHDQHDGTGDEESVGDVEVGPGIEDLQLDFGPDKENPVADAMGQRGGYAREFVEAEPIVKISQNAAADYSQRLR